MDVRLQPAIGMGLHYARHTGGNGLQPVLADAQHVHTDEALALHHQEDRDLEAHVPHEAERSEEAATFAALATAVKH